MSSGLQIEQDGARRRSVGSVEIQGSDGRKRSVALDDLTDADRALAEKFGYKPVCDTRLAGTVKC